MRLDRLWTGFVWKRLEFGINIGRECPFDVHVDSSNRAGSETGSLEEGLRSSL